MLETLKTVVGASAVVCGVDTLTGTTDGNHYVDHLAKSVTLSVYLLEAWFPGPLARFNEAS